MQFLAEGSGRCSEAVENKKIKNATECELDGIKFRSKQERSIYRYLLSVGITPRYETERFTIWDREKFSVPFYDRYGKTFMRINRKPTSVHYTPDFTFSVGDTKVILEVKGFKNDAAPYKIRLFRDYLESLKDSGEKLCYAIVYTIKDLKFLLNDLQKSEESSTFAVTKCENNEEKESITESRGIDTSTSREGC